VSAADAQLWLLTVLPRARFWEGKGKGDEKREEGKWTDDSGWKEWDPTKFVGESRRLSVYFYSYYMFTDT